MESCPYTGDKVIVDSLELAMSVIGDGDNPECSAVHDVLPTGSPPVCPIGNLSTMHYQMETFHSHKPSYCEIEQKSGMSRMVETGSPGRLAVYGRLLKTEGGPNTPDSGYNSENLSPVNAAFYPEQKMMALQVPNVQQISDDASGIAAADMTSFNDARQRCQSCPPTMLLKETYGIDTAEGRPVHGSQNQAPDAASGWDSFFDRLPVLLRTQMASTMDQQFQAGHPTVAEKKPVYRASRQSSGKRKRQNSKEKQETTTLSTKTTKSVNNASKTLSTEKSVAENAKRGDDGSTGPKTTGKEDDKTDRQTDKVDASTIMVPPEEDAVSDRHLPVLNVEPNLPTDSINPDNYISGIFDHNGGHLSMPRLEVKLFIPPGAIARGIQQEIFMYVSWENKHQPRDKTGKTKLSPVVVCGPNGLQFRENVCLNFTHCIDPADKWKLTPVYTATDIDEPSNYQMLVDPDKETHEQSAMCLLDKDTLSILVDHFTGYGLLGGKHQQKKGVKQEPLKQYMFGMVYIDKQEKDIQLRVYLVKQFSGAEQS